MERPDWLLEIDSTSYHKATKENLYTTSHRLNLFRRCPLLYRKTIDGEIVEGDTAAFQLGRAVHVAILEGKEKFDAEYTVCAGPENKTTGKPYGKQTAAYAKWYAEQTKPVIDPEDYAQIEKMNAAVHAHPVAKDLLASGIAEGTVRTTWDGEPVQARFDWFDPERGILLDLKTCADVDRFGYDIRDYNYIHQMSFYGNCLRLAGYTGPLNVYLVAVEKKEPFRVSVTEICALTLLDAVHNHMGGENWRDDSDAMIAELQKCRDTNIWPTRYEKTIVI